jgi:hypothetical protein
MSSDFFEEQLSSELEKELAKIYIGQNIRLSARFGKKQGILKSDVNQDLAHKLLTLGLIREDTWYSLTLYQTTPKGEAYIKPQIQATCSLLNISLICNDIPPRIVAFVIRYYLLPSLIFPAVQPTASTANSSFDRLLLNSEIWEYCSRFLQILEETKLCAKAHFYVSSHGGKIDLPYYVISFELQEHLRRSSIPACFSEKEEAELAAFDVLREIKRLFSSSQDMWVDYSLSEFFRLLEEYQITEDDVKPIIDKASVKGLTSKYEALPNRKPFVIYDPHRFDTYIYNELLAPKIGRLLEKGTSAES